MLKTPEKMRCGLNIGYQICDTQSEIFELAQNQGFDDHDFIKKYMNSDFCHREMDALYSWFHLMDPEPAMYHLLQEITPVKNDTHYDPKAIKWAGWMYKYMQLRFEVPSKTIYQKMPLNILLDHYPEINTKDPEDLIEISEALIT